MDSISTLTDLNLKAIKKYLPNRYPYLLLDRVTEVVPGISARGCKNLSANEWFFAGHFPENPVMPGMIQMEALLQLLSLTVLSLDGNAGSLVRGVSADQIKLKRRVLPGDCLEMEATLLSWENGIGTGRAVGSVDGETACSAEFVFSIQPHDQQ